MSKDYKAFAQEVVARAAQRLGANCEEVADSISVAGEFRGGPSAVYCAEALAAFDQFAAYHQPDPALRYRLAMLGCCHIVSEKGA